MRQKSDDKWILCKSTSSRPTQNRKPPQLAKCIIRYDTTKNLPKVKFLTTSELAKIIFSSNQLQKSHEYMIKVPVLLSFGSDKRNCDEPATFNQAIKFAE